MNKALFYTHRCMMGLYAMMLVLAWIIFIQHGKSDTITVLILLTAIYGGMFFLHLKASNEVKNGTEVKKTLSQGLGVRLNLNHKKATIQVAFLYA
ncbi:hypothetical protein [Acinetobacter sp. V89_7]|uniref:hypothetical protein n=1 Tax=Acinetobacter sp. V89_7 TaxID=3044233 RepID=UPI00249E3ABF|nr:hypothetical protein [Acinetobacter sp. V89_7]MDI3377622.1 hypothetical protein [Acinetobacter sp. V89_7]